jgi:hypothetical protein
LWELDLETECFKEIILPASSFHPSGRSGHSSNIFNGKMYIFGGVFEVMKELNELLCFDFITGCFTLVCGESFYESNNLSSSLKRE